MFSSPVSLLDLDQLALLTILVLYRPHFWASFTGYPSHTVIDLFTLLLHVALITGPHSRVLAMR